MDVWVAPLHAVYCDPIDGLNNKVNSAYHFHELIPTLMA